MPTELASSGVIAISAAGTDMIKADAVVEVVDGSAVKERSSSSAESLAVFPLLRFPEQYEPHTFDYTLRCVPNACIQDWEGEGWKTHKQVEREQKRNGVERRGCGARCV